MRAVLGASVQDVMIRVTLFKFVGKDYREPITDPYPTEFTGDEEHALRLVLLTEPSDVAVLPESKLLVEDEQGLVGAWNRAGALRIASALPDDPTVALRLAELRNAILRAEALRS